MPSDVERQAIGVGDEVDGGREEPIDCLAALLEGETRKTVVCLSLWLSLSLSLCPKRRSFFRSAKKKKKSRETRSEKRGTLLRFERNIVTLRHSAARKKGGKIRSRDNIGINQAIYLSV